jgi:hypothetical protein
MSISFRDTIKLKNLTIFAIFVDTEQNLAMRVRSLPAGSLLKNISRAIDINIFRTIQNDPARIFPVPEI